MTKSEGDDHIGGTSFKKMNQINGKVCDLNCKVIASLQSLTVFCN